MSDPIKDGAGFLWVRYDARDPVFVDALRERKQNELDEHGVFTWGVPSGMAKSIRELFLVLGEGPIPVLFSPDEGRVSRQDNGPGADLVWSDGVDPYGDPTGPPVGLEVTSAGPRRSHSVLVCRTVAQWPPQDENCPAVDLETETGSVVPGMLTHLVTTRPIRPQSTAVAARYEGMVVGSGFRGALPITMRAELVWPMVVSYTHSDPL